MHFWSTLANWYKLVVFFFFLKKQNNEQINTEVVTVLIIYQFILVLIHHHRDDKLRTSQQNLFILLIAIYNPLIETHVSSECQWNARLLRSKSHRRLWECMLYIFHLENNRSSLARWIACARPIVHHMVIWHHKCVFRSESKLVWLS